MNSYEIRYHKEAAGPAVAKARRLMNVSMVVSALAMLVLVAVQVVSAPTANVDGDLAVLGWISISFGYLVAMFAGASIALYLFQWWTMRFARKGVPDAALRLDVYGLWLFPVQRAEFFVPWAGIQGIRVNQQGFGVVLVPGTTADLPGAVGLSDPSVMRTLKMHAQLRNGAMQWRLLAPTDITQLDAALRHFSGGRASVLP